MKINIHIEADNDTFMMADESTEVARILSDLVDSIESGGLGDDELNDINGNKIGYIEITL